MSDAPRYRIAFDKIRSADLSNDTLAIVDALEVIAMELDDMNSAASKLMDFPHIMADVIHHLEKIDASTDESATLARESSGET